MSNKEKEPLSESFIAFVVIFLFIIFSALSQSQPCKPENSSKTVIMGFLDDFNTFLLGGK